jgi:hypothetical protein
MGWQMGAKLRFQNTFKGKASGNIRYALLVEKSTQLRLSKLPSDAFYVVFSPLMNINN